MPTCIDDLISKETETGVGLALRDCSGRYLFFLAGTKFRLPPGELFYAGIGGHREEGESCVECAHREAIEELGVDVELVDADITWAVSSSGDVQRLDVSDQLRPIAMYDMVHGEESSRAGCIYHIVIYDAKLIEPPGELPSDEVRCIIALTPEQVSNALKRKRSITELINEGAEVVACAQPIDLNTFIYPIGTAAALAVLAPFITCYPLPPLNLNHLCP